MPTKISLAFYDDWARRSDYQWFTAITGCSLRLCLRFRMDTLHPGVHGWCARGEPDGGPSRRERATPVCHGHTRIDSPPHTYTQQQQLCIDLGTGSRSMLGSVPVVCAYPIHSWIRCRRSATPVPRRPWPLSQVRSSSPCPRGLSIDFRLVKFNFSFGISLLLADELPRFWMEL